MTNEDLEQIRLIVREVVREMIAPLATDVAMMRGDITQLRNGLQSVEDKFEILTGAVIRSDGTVQELAGMRRMLDHLDQRVRRLENPTPAA